MPPDGLHIRWPDTPLQQEMRLHKYKAYAALAYARANKLNRVVIDGPKRRFGIVTAGKSYLDVRQALDDLGIDEAYARDIGLSIYKVGMTWPLEREGVRQFAEGLEEILVVEEKRALIENQLKEQLYNWKENVRPRVIGKFDEERNWILPSADELTPARIARVIAKRIARFHTSPDIEQRLAFLDEKEKALDGAEGADLPPALFLLRLSAQHLDQGARGQPRAGRHRLPLHGAVDGPQHRHLHPDGRRRRHLDRPGAVQQDRAMCSRIWATAPTTIPACWRSAPASPPASTSPTRSSTTTRWR